MCADICTYIHTHILIYALLTLKGHTNVSCYYYYYQPHHPRGKLKLKSWTFQLAPSFPLHPYSSWNKTVLSHIQACHSRGSLYPQNLAFPLRPSSRDHLLPRPYLISTNCQGTLYVFCVYICFFFLLPCLEHRLWECKTISYFSTSWRPSRVNVAGAS